MVFIFTLLMLIVDYIGGFSYFARSAIKIFAFFILPLIYIRIKNISLPSLKPNKNTKKIYLASILVLILILSSAFILNKFNIFENVKASLANNVSVSKSTYPLVFAYIVLINGPLEEFFFRYFAILKSNKLSVFISSLLFAIYHVGMLYNMFPWYLFSLIILGLAIVGYFFIKINEKESIINSIIIHMVANIAINTVGAFILYKKSS